MMYEINMTSGGMIYIPSFMKNHARFEAILRFSFSNLKSCNVGITDGRYL
jgi:hypothetical protein